MVKIATLIVTIAEAVKHIYLMKVLSFLVSGTSRRLLTIARPICVQNNTQSSRTTMYKQKQLLVNYLSEQHRAC